MVREPEQMMNYMSRTSNTCLPTLGYVKSILLVKLILVLKKQYKIKIQSHTTLLQWLYKHTGMFCQLKDLAVNHMRIALKLRL